MSVDPFDKDVPTITLDQEDRDAFQRSRQKASGKSTPPTKTPEPNAPKSGSSGFLTFLTFVLALGGASSGVYLFLENQTLLENQTQAQRRIQDLENQLSATGAELGDSAAAIQAKLTQVGAKTDELWQQMDKLWASAWRRNQQEIKDLSKDLENNTAELKQLLADTNTELGLNQTNLTALQEKLSQQGKLVANLSQDLTANQKTDTDFENRLAEIAGLITNNELAITEIARQVSANQTNIKKVQNPPQTVPKLPTPVGAGETGSN